MFGTLGAPELIVIGLVLLLIFGPSRLPKIGKAAGDTIREWRGVQKEIENAHEDLKDLTKR